MLLPLLLLCCFGCVWRHISNTQELAHTDSTTNKATQKLFVVDFCMLPRKFLPNNQRMDSAWRLINYDIFTTQDPVVNVKHGSRFWRLLSVKKHVMVNDHCSIRIV